MFGVVIFTTCAPDVDVSQIQEEIYALQQKVDDLEQREEVQSKKKKASIYLKCNQDWSPLRTDLPKQNSHDNTSRGRINEGRICVSDPRGTKLSKTNLQDAMTELENRLDDSI